MTPMRHLEAKLEAGHSGYDVVVPTAMPYLAREAAAGVFMPIDKAKLSNYGDLDPQILAAGGQRRPGNKSRCAVYVGHDGHRL